jgi:hypothetical protein
MSAGSWIIYTPSLSGWGCGIISLRTMRNRTRSTIFLGASAAPFFSNSEGSFTLDVGPYRCVDYDLDDDSLVLTSMSPAHRTLDGERILSVIGSLR